MESILKGVFCFQHTFSLEFGVARRLAAVAFAVFHCSHLSGTKPSFLAEYQCQVVHSTLMKGVFFTTSLMY